MTNKHVYNIAYFVYVTIQHVNIYIYINPLDLKNSKFNINLQVVLFSTFNCKQVNYFEY